MPRFLYVCIGKSDRMQVINPRTSCGRRNTSRSGCLPSLVDGLGASLALKNNLRSRSIRCRPSALGTWMGSELKLNKSGKVSEKTRDGLEVIVRALPRPTPHGLQETQRGMILTKFRPWKPSSNAQVCGTFATNSLSDLQIYRSSLYVVYRSVTFAYIDRHA